MFEISLLPYGGEEVFMNPDAVVQLVLEEDLFFWAMKGFIIFQNGYEMFERSIQKRSVMGILDASTLSQLNADGYIFRNDGKDRIRIRVKPIKSPYIDDPAIEEPPDSHWLIDFTGNIYDMEEPMVSDLGSKVKKIYFWDERFQKMLERDLYNEEEAIWSTATSTLNESVQNNPNYDPKNATNLEREMFTGDAIKDIILNYLDMSVDEESFDRGSTRIFHTAPANSNVWDNISYLLDSHLSELALKSSNYDVCVFIYDRYEDHFKLMPLSKIFEKAGDEIKTPGEYQIEHLLLEDMGRTDQADRMWMAPIKEQYDPRIDVKITKLKKYSFSDMAGVDSMRDMVTTAVHTYDHKNKTFVKSVENSVISDIPEKLKTDYIEPNFLYRNPETHINMNRIKNENLRIKNAFTPISKLRCLDRKGHANLIFKSVLLNLCLTVELDGSTHRKVARFIGVDRLSNNENEFDYKLGGQWFVVNVKHNFFRNTYSNELVCVKPQVFDTIPVEENVN